MMMMMMTMKIEYKACVDERDITTKSQHSHSIMIAGWSRSVRFRPGGT